MFKVTVYPLSLDLLYTSYVWTGLYDLEAQGKLTIDISMRPRADLAERNGVYQHPQNISVFCMRVEHPVTKEHRLLYFDLMDSEGIASKQGLQSCDLYFKRSYRAEFVRTRMLFPEHRHKIHPLGLWFPVLSPNQHSELKRALVAEFASGIPLRRPSESLWRLTARIKDVRENRRRKNTGDDWSRNDKREFETAAHIADKKQIQFLTRVFDPDSGWNAQNRDYVIAKNEQRVEIIRGMRKHFGHRFIGGLMDEPVARATYPDCIATVSTVRSDYLRLLRESRVAISTTGLMDSIPAKVAEYIAASRCVLTDPLLYELPFQVTHERNAMIFNSTEECVSFGERLLADDELAAYMRRENEKLYREEVDPAAAIQRCIQFAFPQKPDVGGQPSG